MRSSSARVSASPSSLAVRAASRPLPTAGPVMNLIRARTAAGKLRLQSYDPRARALLRGDSDLGLRVQHDIFYIENWSVWLDAQIVLLTFVRWRDDSAY